MNRHSSARSGGRIEPEPPGWAAIESAVRGIFRRRYFTNHGPVARQLDAAVADVLQLTYGVAVASHALAVMVLAKGLGLQGEVVLPLLASAETIQGLTWAGLKPVFCDVDAETQMVTPATAVAKLTNKTSAMVAVDMWGGACDIGGLRSLARKYGTALVVDATASFGSRPVTDRAEADACVAAFDQSGVVYGLGASCVATSHEGLAERLRTIRSFHPGETYAQVPLRINAKISEMQAAITLAAIEELPAIFARNALKHERYGRLLSGIPGIHLLPAAGSRDSNGHYVVLDVAPFRVGADRDLLHRRLRRLGIGVAIPYGPELAARAARLGLKSSAALAKRLLRLPNSSATDVEHVGRSLRRAAR